MRSKVNLNPYRQNRHIYNFLSGHYIVGPMGVNFSTKDLNATLLVEGDSPVWTFEASIDQRIQFVFPHDFRVFTNIEIGDGMIKGQSTRLARFNPVFETPSDVTSISHLAWLSTDVNHG